MAKQASNASEQWRAIPSLPGYEASTEGRIRSLDRIVVFNGRWGVTHRRHRGKVLRLKIKSNGYRQIYSDGRAYHHVHRLIAETFHGPAPSPIHEAAHKDRDQGNNRPDNIVWATPLENAAHKTEHGTNPDGEKNGCARLMARQIEPIFDAYIAGAKAAHIAALIGVTASQVNHIIARKAWRSQYVPPQKVALAAHRAAENVERARRESNERRSRFAGHLSRSSRPHPVQGQRQDALA